MVKTVLFGGSFDPVHNGHIHLAKNALSLADRVVFMPCFANPFGKNIIAPPEDRLMMLRLAVSGESRFEVSDYELNKGGVSYTIDTIEYLKQAYPGELILMMGSDAFMDIEKWYRAEEIMQSVTILVYNRPGVTTEKINEFLKKDFFSAAKVLSLEISPQNVSSTQVKIYYYMNEPVEEYLSPEVLNYLNSKGLYLKEKQYSNSDNI